MEIQLNSLIIWSKASNLRFLEIEQEIANVSIFESTVMLAQYCYQGHA